MAVMKPVPRPAARDIDALWKYVDALAQEMEHVSRSIDADNLLDGTVTMDKLAPDVQAAIRGDTA